MRLFENGLMKGPEIPYVDHHSFVTAGCNNMNQLSAKIEHGIQGKNAVLFTAKPVYVM